jgi:hypothetical protein
MSDYQPIEWINPFLEGVEVKELPPALAWLIWDQAVRELDKFNSGVPASPSRSTFQPAVSTSIANAGDTRG